MIFSNLAGTTNNQFKVNGDGTGQILSNNAYDLFWACPDPITGAKNPNVRLLPNNADLDEYRLFPHMGQWYSTMETTATIENLPDGVTAEFTLLILTNSGNWDGYLRQEIVTNDGVKFERRFNGFQTPSWSAWKQVAYKSDIPTMETGAFIPSPYKPEYYSFTSTGNCTYRKIQNIINIIYNINLSVIKDGGAISFRGLPYNVGDWSSVTGRANVVGLLNTKLTVAIPKTNYWTGEIDFRFQSLGDNNLLDMLELSSSNILEHGGSRRLFIQGWATYLI